MGDQISPDQFLAGIPGMVGNDSSASRVDSMIPQARMTEQLGPIGMNCATPLTEACNPVTVPFATSNA
jgi:hypothetical protein